MIIGKGGLKHQGLKEVHIHADSFVFTVQMWLPDS